MDWARAKTILILLLLTTNLIIAATIVVRVAGGGADRGFYDDVTKILESRGVIVQNGFPKEITDSGLLIYGDGGRFVDNCAKALNTAGAGSDGSGSGNESGSGSDAGRVAQMLGRESLRYVNPNPDEALNITSITVLDAAVRRILADWGIDIAGFATDYAAQQNSGGYLLQYILVFEGNKVFDSRFIVEVDAFGGITGILINYRDIKAVSPDKEMDISPAYQILLKNYYSDAVISSIDIGFMGQNTMRDNPFIESEEGAVWRVRLDDGSERFFEAAYGDEIFHSTVIDHAQN